MKKEIVSRTVSPFPPIPKRGREMEIRGMQREGREKEDERKRDGKCDGGSDGNYELRPFQKGSRNENKRRKRLKIKFCASIISSLLIINFNAKKRERETE